MGLPWISSRAHGRLACVDGASDKNVGVVSLLTHKQVQGWLLPKPHVRDKCGAASGNKHSAVVAFTLLASRGGGLVFIRCKIESYLYHFRTRTTELYAAISAIMQCLLALMEY